MFRSRLRNGFIVPLTMVLLFAFTSSAFSSTSGASSNAKSTSLKLPAKYRNGIVEAVTAGYPPYSYQKSNGQLGGLEPALSKALAKVLGVKITIDPESFDNELLGLNDGKFTFVPSLNVTASRLKVYNMVSYVKDGSTLAALKSDPALGATPMSVCGHTVADEVGDAALTVVAQWSKNCVSKGKGAIKILTYPANSSAELAVSSKRAQYVVGYLSVLGAFFKTPAGKDWRLTGPKFDVTLVADGFLKSSPLATYFQKALNALIANGTYARILNSNGFKSNAVAHSYLNPSSSAG